MNMNIFLVYKVIICFYVSHLLTFDLSIVSQMDGVLVL